MSTASTIGLISALFDGRMVGREEARRLLGTEVAAADAQLKCLLDSKLPIEKTVARGKTFYRWTGTAQPPMAPVGLPTVLGGHFAASLATLFEPTGYASGIRQAAQTLANLSPRPGRFQDADRKFVFISRGGEIAFPKSEDVLTDLVDILLDGFRTRLVYRDQKGRRRAVEVEPLSVAVYDHQLYLIGRRGDRTLHPYRFARIEKAVRLSKKVVYPPRSNYDPEQLFRDSIGIYLDDKYPVVQLRLKVSERWAQFMQSHRWHRSQFVERTPEGPILKMRVRHCPELSRWALGFGSEAEVLEPLTLRAEIAAVAEQMATLYKSNRNGRRAAGPKS